MDDKKTIGIVDYVIFGALLLSSSLVGIYFGYKHRKRVTSAEYLLANKSMSWFTICISLVVSFFSSVGVMGITTNIYMTGVTFSLHMLTFLVPIILNAEFFAPIFRRLELISVNHYLELRFSRGVRFIGCFLFFLQYVIYLAIVLYAPSLALETVADVPLMATIITTGLVCTFYTTLGGMRAVIWTDVFQSMVMVIGLGTSLVIGVINIGSFEKIYNVTSEFKRFDIDINPDPRGHQTVWGVTIGGTFSIMAAWTISQPTMQRVIAARSLGDAKKALYGAYVGLLLIGAFLTTLAIVIFATYAECDLLKSGKIKSPDQVLPYYVVDNFSHIPGVTGVFIACLFSFSISTLSSALNSLAAVFLEDIVKSFNPVLSETFQTRVSKIVACVLGVVITGLAFVVPLIGNSIIKLVIQLFGIVSGPYFGLFVLGIFFKKSNSVGAGVGSVIGLLVGIAMMVGQWFYPPGKNLPPVSMAQCTNVTKPDLKFIYPPDPVYKDNIIADMVSFSYMWFGFITVVLTVFIGYLVSLCHGRCNKEEFVDKILLYQYSGCCGCCGGCCSCCDGDGETSYEPYDREVQLMMMKKDQEMEAEDERRNDVVM